MKIAMNQFGTSLCTRASGRAAYALINDVLDTSSEELILFDFSDVFSVTNSFADESFGRLASERGIDFLRQKTSFNEINRDVALSIRAAMDRRIAQKELVQV